MCFVETASLRMRLIPEFVELFQVLNKWESTCCVTGTAVVVKESTRPSSCSSQSARSCPSVEGAV